MFGTKCQKGMPKTPGSGRKKGSLNKRPISAAETLTRLGFNGLEEMWNIWQDPLSTPGIRAKMVADMTSYQFHKLKQIEHSGPEGGPIRIVEVVDYSRDEDSPS